MSEYERRSSRTRLSKLHEINQRTAREKARGVLAGTLATLIDQRIDCLAFVLWARAIVEAEHTVPPQVEAALQLRCRGFVPDGDDTKTEFWLRMCRWIDDNVFRQPNEEGWLIAVEYYASRNLRWEQLWLYWEHCDELWQKARPHSYPTFEGWRRAAEQWRFPPPARQRVVCGCAHRANPAQLRKAVSDYIDWEAFAYWVRAVMRAYRGMPPRVAELLSCRCPGFLDQLKGEGLRLEDPTTVWRRLIAWVDDRVFGSAKAEGWFEAITFFARSSLQADRTVAYWAACDRKWSRRRPADVPDFDAWRRDAESYTEL